jgi:DNA-binding LytR/AlgR family response regulator
MTSTHFVLLKPAHSIAWLKPFDDARFHRALNRAKERLAHHVPLQPQRVERLVVKSAGRVVFLDAAEIDWIEAADYYACLHVGNARHLLRRTLSDLERDLDGAVFCRIHRSVIVNLHRIRGLEIGDDGEYEVALISGERLRLSRRSARTCRIDWASARGGREYDRKASHLTCSAVIAAAINSKSARIPKLGAGEYPKRAITKFSGGIM